MNLSIKTSLAMLLSVACAAVAAAEEAATHTVVDAGGVTWSDGPASLEPGSQMAVLYGTPSEEGLFALRLKLPAGYAIAPHAHPRPEIVTVISGTFLLGTGETADMEDARALPAGSFFAFDPGMTHYAFTEEETVIQLNSSGPWDIVYVDPSDDPRQ